MKTIQIKNNDKIVTLIAAKGIRGSFEGIDVYRIDPNICLSDLCSFIGTDNARKLLLQKTNALLLDFLLDSTPYDTNKFNLNIFKLIISKEFK